MLRLFPVLALLAWCPVPLSAQEPAAGGVPALVTRLEAALRSGSPQELSALAAPGADTDLLTEFAGRWLTSGTTAVTLRERDRQTLEDGGARLLLEVLLESGRSGRLATWQVDVTPPPHAIASIVTLGSVEGLHRLVLDVSRQYRASNLRIAGEDFELLLPSGAVFMAEAPDGPTALVLVGRGTMVFSPAPETERGQLRIFARTETLRAEFDWAFVRLNPQDLRTRLDPATLQATATQARPARTAQMVFQDRVTRSFSFDLADLSAEPWSIVPTPGDMLADVRTRRHGTLTYAQSASEPEDVTLFDRDRRRNIAVYASRARLAARGPFYDEDDLADLDVQSYAVDAFFSPDRLWLDARSRLTVRVQAHALTSVRLRLASTLAVRSVSTDRFGRMLFLRVRGQDSLIVNLPATVLRNTVLTFTIAYAGRIEPHALDQEALALQRPTRDDGPLIEPEPSLLYSHRSYWYPQISTPNYGTASIRLTLPPPFAAVCSGEPAEGSPVALQDESGEPRLLHVFTAARPIRYLGCVIGRLTPGETRVVGVPATSDAHGNGQPALGEAELRLSVHAAPRLRGRGRDLLERAADISGFYAGVMEDAPFPTLALAVLESHVPGGHSPAYFAAVNQPLPTSPFTWRNDPAAFDNYPEFFLAHEVAHQWWGQAVGWKNYHEQWLSEGFAQYFAALYAEHRRGPDVFGGIIRSMSRWAVSASPQGPVYLGYRLGHLQNDGRVFRALVYNKGALVLHMLRRLTGDEAFFRALRRFYREQRFSKAGTDDLRAAFEAETGREWSAFFDQWIYGSSLPRIKTSWRVDGAGEDRHVQVRIEQTSGVFEFPVTVTVMFTDGSSREEVVRIAEGVVEHRVAAPANVRAVHVNRDSAAPIGN